MSGRYICIITSIASLLFLSSEINCGQTRFQTLRPNDTIVVSEIVDLGGKTIEMPKDVTISFNGGVITNGTIKFNNTKLLGDVKAYVHIHPESVINNTLLNCSWFTRNINSGTKTNDVSETINELIAIVGNYNDGLYSYTPTIYLPAGIYYCHRPINISTVRKGKDLGKRTISMRGDPGTRIVAVNQMEYLFGRPLSESSSSFSGVTLALENISFDGNLRVDHTMNLSRVSKSSFRNIKALGGIQTNLYMNFAFINYFENCSFYSWDVFKPTSIDVFLGPQDVNAINFVGCVFEGANLGAYCGDGYTINFDGCVFEGLRCAAAYVYKADQVFIRGCYFEENTTTKNNKNRKDFEWNSFGIKGTTDGVKNKKVIEIHADVFLNNAALKPDCNFSDIKLTNTTAKEQASMKSTGAVTLIGNSVQRINSCTSDNYYHYQVPNDAFVFLADERPVTLTGNSVISIYADEVKGIWRTANGYKTPILLKLTDKHMDDNNIFLQNNYSASQKYDMIEKIYIINN